MIRIDRRTALQTAVAMAFAPSVLNAAQDPYADAKFVDGPPPKPADGSFCVAVLPDTQYYSEQYPDTFVAQTRWIVEQQAKRNIAAVLHLGDITNRNTPGEWKAAQKAMRELDGKLPYFLTLGNHDYSTNGGCTDRTTHFNEYFAVDAFRAKPFFGGTYDKEPTRLENSYGQFSAGDRKFLVLALEFGPRNDVLRWANEVVAKYPKHEVILVSHAIIYHDETRYNFAKYGTKQNWNPHSYKLAKTTGDDVNDGEQLWDKLISKHENFVFTLNGHVIGDGLGRVTTRTPGGRDVPQVLVNFQMKPHGGDGWLRLLEFRADRKTVEVFDYSPTLNRCNVSAQNRFAMMLAPVKA